MNLSVGIAGLPNVGKSTLFNALLKRQLAKTAPYPFTTIEPSEGVVDVPDERLNKLAELIKPEKVTPASIEFIDIAGLVKGAHKGEGLGNEFLGQIKNVDVIAEVIRSFPDENIEHVLGTIEPERDKEIVQTELILKDLETVNKVLDKEKDIHKKNIFEKVKNGLNKGKQVREMIVDEEEGKLVLELNLLTAKPIFYILNIPEDQLNSKNVSLLEDNETVVVSAKIEEEIAALTSDEQREYLSSYGISESGLNKVINKSKKLLDLITFYTIKGGREVRAWSIRRGSSTIEAANMVHSDMAKGFIKAEVISFREFAKLGNWHKAHEEGKINLMGKDHQIADGDIVEFKFSV
ncbi:redox-regulated ATPase YchF [Candidatus Gottesmanbacteria bacterium]|nr:redox-regulated ATPase YchF [Candidatus Gottesmanbacteria bacterium]